MSSAADMVRYGGSGGGASGGGSDGDDGGDQENDQRNVVEPLPDQLPICNTVRLRTSVSAKYARPRCAVFLVFFLKTELWVHLERFAYALDASVRREVDVSVTLPVVYNLVGVEIIV